MRGNRNFVILAGILLLAAAVRLWGIDYGLPCTYCRPDEDRLIATALRLSLRDPHPHYFIWPGLFFYLTRGVLETAALIHRLLESGPAVTPLRLYLADPTGFHLVLRYIFCGFGVATVYFLYRLGRRLFSPAAGLLASFFLALTFLHVRDSHFAMLDIPAALLAVVFFLPAERICERGRWSDYLWSGLLLGLASATKYYAVLLAVPLITAHLSRGGRGKRSGRWRLTAALVLSAAIFLAGSPYTLLDAGSFARQIKDEILAPQFVSGFHLLPGLQTPRGWLYHIVFSFRYGMGWPLEVLALVGVGLAVLRAIRGRIPERLLLSFILPFYLALSFQKSCFIRYTTLLLPFLCLLAAVLLVSLRSRGKCPAVLLALLSASIMLEPALRIIGLDQLLSRPDTRNLAGDWMEGNIPLTSAVIYSQPFIFGRPDGFFRYPNRISAPQGLGAAEMRSLLDLDLPGTKYAVIHESPLAYSSPDPEITRLLAGEGELVYRIDAFQLYRARVVFDPFDAFYVPLAGFREAAFPGPDIRIYGFRKAGIHFFSN
ncbi:MAG: glycosyltransferase family 39 protein [PVC group bacterium]